MYTYKHPSDEIALSKAIDALQQEYSSSDITLSVPTSWQVYKQELETGLHCQFQYDTQNTIILGVKGTTIRRVTELVEVA